MIESLGRLQRVHHLNCGTFRPWPKAVLSTHVLVCEFEHGLVLIDSGLGSADVKAPDHRLGRTVRPLRPSLRESDTAVSQIAKLGGWSPDDVSSVVATHLDYDHIGGASDFPDAHVYTTRVELEAAVARLSTKQKIRYRAMHIADTVSRTVVAPPPASSVLGLSATQLDSGGALYLIPLQGHTSGHAAIAVRDPARGWLIHAGDAFMHRAAIGIDVPSIHSRIAGVAERLLATDTDAVRSNHRTLAALASDSTVRVFCSHDQQQFDILRAESIHSKPHVTQGRSGEQLHNQAH